MTASDHSNNASGGVLMLRLSDIAGATVCSVPPCPCQTEGEVTLVTLALPAGYAAGPSTPSSLVRLLPVSQCLLELASDDWVLECGVLSCRGA